MTATSSTPTPPVRYCRFAEFPPISRSRPARSVTGHPGQRARPPGCVAVRVGSSMMSPPPPPHAAPASPARSCPANGQPDLVAPLPNPSDEMLSATFVHEPALPAGENLAARFRIGGDDHHPGAGHEPSHQDAIVHQFLEGRLEPCRTSGAQERQGSRCGHGPVQGSPPECSLRGASHAAPIGQPHTHQPKGECQGDHQQGCGCIGADATRTCRHVTIHGTSGTERNRSARTNSLQASGHLSQKARMPRSRHRKRLISIQKMDHHSRSQLGLEPGRFGRHDAAGVGH